MPTRPATSPGALAVGAALDQSSPLSSLLQRLQASRRFFDAIAPLLPEALAGELRPGPIDDQAWTLLASSGAAAAKTRQLLPLLLAAAAAAGWQGTSITVRVQPRPPTPPSPPARPTKPARTKGR